MIPNVDKARILYAVLKDVHDNLAPYFTEEQVASLTEGNVLDLYTAEDVNTVLAEVAEELEPFLTAYSDDSDAILDLVEQGEQAESPDSQGDDMFSDSGSDDFGSFGDDDRTDEEGGLARVAKEDPALISFFMHFFDKKQKNELKEGLSPEVSETVDKISPVMSPASERVFKTLYQRLFST